MDTTPRTARRLISLGQFLLESGDWEAFAEALRREWTPARLSELLASGSAEVARCAAAGLGLIGGISCSSILARALHHPNASVAWGAEHALWRVWFRAFGIEAQQTLYDVVHQLKIGPQPALIRELDSLVRSYPVFAEAYNQRGLAHYLCGNHPMALLDYGRAIHLNRYHFAARAGQGHCLALAGRYREALDCYLAARQIHPRLEGVRQSIRQIRDLLAGQPERGGSAARAAADGSIVRR